MKLVIACFLVFALCFQAGTLAIDSYLLAIQWPKSFCNSLTGNDSCTSVPNHFTIHGFWPQMANGTPVPAPPVIQPFNISLVKNDPALYQTMQKIWPGITVKKPNAQFWEHEWDKHGAFSSFTQHDYFEIAVERANDLGVLQLVQELNKPPAGIIIGKKYTVQYFKNAIQAVVRLKLGKTLDKGIKCNNDLTPPRPKQPVIQIFEIRFCTDNTGLQFINCSSMSGAPCSSIGAYALPPP
ncbi:hypothetical protein FH972_000496 [Carpinus fangiana]|uniref:Uncharacterized protein n=1 Tax=Carpinus fangiana TaxID=176857 RepID=A0A5N6Q988_9ROSI|nr:hypothetical protein FH972_000496 [Carpinus fangiana]